MKHILSQRRDLLLPLGSVLLAVSMLGAVTLSGALAVAAAWVAGAVLLIGASSACWAARRRAAELEATRAKVERLRQLLEQTPSAPERFLGNLAHEIKTPLAIVLNQAELILRCSEDPAVVRREAKSIVDYLVHLAALFDGFLRLGSPDATSTALHPLPVHLHDTVMEAVRRSQSTARGYGVSIVATLAEETDEAVAAEVAGDPPLLEAMIENLLRNAVRRSPRGAQVELRDEVGESHVLLRIRDHGAAIQPAALRAAFEWYFQAPGSMQRAESPGVGLAIAKRVAEHHRGTLTLRNHSEGGCEFVVSLPRWCAEDDRPESRTDSAAASTSRPVRSPDGAAPEEGPLR